MDDGSIVDLFLKRDENAIKQTSEKYGKRLRTLAYKIVEDFQSAEECENDTYLEAWNAIPPHEPRGYFYAFLARITRNHALNICRDKSRLKRKAYVCELTYEMEQCIPAPNDLECRIDNMALGEAINGFLAGLKTDKRMIFVRRYWYMDSVSDIAKRFDISENKVATILFRCRKGLKKHLIKEGYTL